MSLDGTVYLSIYLLEKRRSIMCTPLRVGRILNLHSLRVCVAFPLISNRHKYPSPLKVLWFNYVYVHGILHFAHRWKTFPKCRTNLANASSLDFAYGMPPPQDYIPTIKGFFFNYCQAPHCENLRYEGHQVIESKRNVQPTQRPTSFFSSLNAT